MVIWDNDTFGAAEDGSKCSLCGERLRYPYISWTMYWHSCGDKYFCRECCNSLGNGNGGGTGLARDLKEVATAREVKELGFDPHKARTLNSSLFIPRQSNRH
jgi:hypothetical protein